MAQLSLADIKLLVLDFDGVLTDNRVWVFEDGREAVVCDRSDGLGLSLLKAANVGIVVLSTESNPVVMARCRKLKLECRQNLNDKGAVLKALVRERDISMSQVAYVGNDINDLECLKMAGFGIVVADAHPAVIEAASWVLSKPGGSGAVREECDRVLYEREKREGNYNA